MIKNILLLAVLFFTSSSYAAQPSNRLGGCSELGGVPKGSLLLFGEMHGSKEAPSLMSQLACSLSKHQEIAVGLEIPSRDQHVIDAYLSSDGTPADTKMLLSTQFWQTGRDGRSSAAMLQLIETIRKLKEAGRAIELFAFDDQPGTSLERNVAIANSIRRFRKNHPAIQVIALMGNIHAMQEPLAVGAEKVLPSGYLLKDLNPTSILITYPKGSIWACMPDCRVHELSPRTAVSGPPGFKQGANLSGYSHMYLLKSITASTPAISNVPMANNSFEANASAAAQRKR